MKIIAFVGLLALQLGGPNFSLAKTSAKEGIEKIKLNVDNSIANTDDYKKNLAVVEKNIAEVAKARAQAEDQKKQTQGQMSENKTNLGRLDRGEKGINQLIMDEKNKSTSEEKKIKELEESIAKIKDNLQKREKNVQDYQLQLTQIQEERKIWQTRGETLKEQDTQVSARVKALAQQEGEWKNKKRGYEGEISRWSKETEKQKKLFDQYSTLAETKE